MADRKWKCEIDGLFRSFLILFYVLDKLDLFLMFEDLEPDAGDSEPNPGVTKAMLDKELDEIVMARDERGYEILS